MPSCLQLPLAQIHRTMGTVLASSFLNIQGTQGAWLEVAPTQAALHSLDIPLQEEGWGGGGLCGYSSPWQPWGPGLEEANMA